MRARLSNLLKPLLRFPLLSSEPYHKRHHDEEDQEKRGQNCESCFHAMDLESHSEFYVESCAGGARLPHAVKRPDKEKKVVYSVVRIERER